ncbi:hypothetical protein [Streptomyces sp. NPDC059063]|uniref:hypothetical protein n=1 Tax=unclassified Streptomyces TaxID=2593676 RepID=UPI00369931A3
MAKPKKNANNEGTIYQRKDGRWEGSAYVLTTDGTYKRRSVYGKTWDSWRRPGTTGCGPRTNWRSASASGGVSCWGCAGRTWIFTKASSPSGRLFSGSAGSC